MSPDSDLPIKVGVDQGAWQNVLRKLQAQGLIVLFQAHDLEQTFRGVAPQGRAFRLDVSFLDGPDMLGDHRFDQVSRLLGKGREADVEHIYACYLNRVPYFVTENPKDFIANGRREALEALLGVKIRRTDEFVEDLRSRGIEIES